MRQKTGRKLLSILLTLVLLLGLMPGMTAYAADGTLTERKDFDESWIYLITSKDGGVLTRPVNSSLLCATDDSHASKQRWVLTQKMAYIISIPL